jgi:hypothetical protein
LIAYGVCIGIEERFTRFAEPGIRLAAGPDAVVLKRSEQKSIFTAYNSILDEARGLPDLEAVVLLHDDAELRDPDFEAKVRMLFSDPSIGLLGAIGASGVTSLSWWEAEPHGRVSWDGFPGEDGRVDDFGTETMDVDTVDGFLLVLSPWVVTHLRFDERTFRGFVGYAADLSFTVRRAGRRVVVGDFPLHHHTKVHDLRAFLQANARWRAKWGFESKLLLPARLGWIALRTRKGAEA